MLDGNITKEGDPLFLSFWFSSGHIIKESLLIFLFLKVFPGAPLRMIRAMIFQKKKNIEK